MTKRATPISLSPEVEGVLHEWIESAARQQLMAERAKIVLMAAEHRGTHQIARTLGIRPARVSKWRTRFAVHGIAGLQTADRTGKPRSYDESVDARILALVDQMPPEPHTVWTGPLLAEEVGEVSLDYVWRVLRTHHIHLRRRDQTDYETRSPVVRSLVNAIGFYLTPRASVFLMGIASPETASSLDRLRTYVHVPNPDAAANLKRYVGTDSRPTLLQALEWAVALVAGRQPIRDSRTVDEFLADAATHSGARQVSAFVSGKDLPVPRDIQPHFLGDFETWRDLLGAALTISLEEAVADPPMVQRILAAVTQFVYSQRAGQAAAFEWHAWSVASHPPRTHRTNVSRSNAG